MTDTLLVELLTEELPPKALRALSEAFARALVEDLRKDDLLEQDSAVETFATPRRLALRVTHVRDRAPDKPLEMTGPLVTTGLDASGKPTKALEGFARKCGASIRELERRDSPKGRVFVYRTVGKGSELAATLSSKVDAALKTLPIPKVMRWGGGDAQFVRPVHGLVMMHGPRVISGPQVLGLDSANRTFGHRFLVGNPVVLKHADEYEQALRDQGKVVASFEVRRREIVRQLESAAGGGAQLAPDDALFDEVTALVEAPAVYEGRFSPEFLEVPQECLVLSMKQHQRYFPLFDKRTGKLLPRFLLVSNLKADDPSPIIHGNERVLRARLSDAKFFYDQDRKVRLEERVPQLASVVYHSRLGSQLQRVERIQLLAGRIARELGADVLLAERAAWLSKADLLTGMVGEFPELQGIMGRYYALHDGEPKEVADTIEGHYRPRFAGDTLPAGKVACAVALADKLEALAGLFGIGQQPSGDKDPFALRRHALGVVRILAERDLPLPLRGLVTAAFAAFERSPGSSGAHTDLETFIFERLRGYCLDQGYTANEVESVLCLKPDRIDLVPKQIEAVRAFAGLPEAQSLAAANKRIANILKQAEQVPSDFDSELLVQPEERSLALAFTLIHPDIEGAFQALDYTRALKTLASLKGPVDAFFDKVLVMDEDLRLRANRIGFLGRLHATMNRIADLSKLAA